MVSRSSLRSLIHRARQNRSFPSSIAALTLPPLLVLTGYHTYSHQSDLHVGKRKIQQGETSHYPPLSLDTPSGGPFVLATSPSSSTNKSLPSSLEVRNEHASNNVETFDFVVVGNGNAGQSAARTLTKLCPSGTIAIIDPKTPPMSSPPNNVSFHGEAVIGLDHTNRTLKLANGAMVRFRSSVLLATGARGAPPPESLVDDRAMSRILELRSTEAFFPNEAATTNGGRRTRRPVIHMEGVRQMTAVAASQGAKICILGGGIEAVELAVSTANASARNGHSQRKKRKSRNASNNFEGEKEQDQKVSLVFGSAGPLSSLLPRYLSTAVAKRLRQNGIDVQGRSLVRYVAKNQNPNDQDEVEIHTSKSYDSMDTKRTLADLIVLAPSVSGQQGTAVFPIPGDAQNVSSLKLSSSFNSWANLSPFICCYADDGRIIVNSELNAASHIYAAGSVAKYPNSQTGHATVSGEGPTGANLAGEIAAHNMAKEFQESYLNGSFFGTKQKIQIPRLFSLEALPIWRSDLSSAFSAVGIHALCIGNCDSETMATHGFFWTNQSSDLKKRATLLRSTTKARRGNRTSPFGRHPSGDSFPTVGRSVYGSGVIFYVDRTGAIQGVMTWGLPFASSGENGESNLNTTLVERMKEIIRTNGEIAKQCHHRAVVKRDPRLELSLLSSYHLSEESKLLASIALESQGKRGRRTQLKSVEGLCNPLHRYVPSKPVNITSIGMLKRTDEIGTGGIGEDLFARTSSTECSEDERPPSLIHVYPLNWGYWGSGPTSTNSSWPSGSMEEQGNEIKETEAVISFSPDPNTEHKDFEKASRTNELRSRPPKEEQLWVRERDANKFVAVSDVLQDAFRLNMRSGRFHDGSDSVRQAPTPQTFVNLKEKFIGLVGGVGDDEAVAEDDDHIEK